MDAKFRAFVETEVIRKEGNNWEMRERMFHSFKKYVIGLHHADFTEMLQQYFKYVRKKSENGFLITIAKDLTEKMSQQVQFVITEIKNDEHEDGGIYHGFEGGWKLKLTVRKTFFEEELVRLYPQHLWTLGHEVGHFLVWLGTGHDYLQSRAPLNNIEPLPTIWALTENLSQTRDSDKQMQRSFGLLIEELCDFAGFAFLEHMFELGVREHTVGYCQSRKCWVHAEKPK